MPISVSEARECRAVIDCWRGRATVTRALRRGTFAPNPSKWSGALSLEQIPRRVMVGTDRSETAEQAVRWAAGFAERFDAELHVVQVITPRADVAPESSRSDLDSIAGD